MSFFFNVIYCSLEPEKIECMTLKGQETETSIEIGSFSLFLNALLQFHVNMKHILISLEEKLT
jgi:hypothetical protein